ncbi:hypothetical protein VIBNISOn1_550016 [Vibrio nigripulchritudo SOn1]|uniref:Bro-N domain-containing protein n=1 Tax=Vibrio nigripulchritudo SOn1 TaxID=1238450 RepID=A0AAV2VUT6_9VIBR|nr:BRO family protein [Vibrio nigripulchritudo]CCO48464.1 hypothetical protein VIBNISOn1_550016 [Vibrio nigripulchritudo SOn1]
MAFGTKAGRLTTMSNQKTVDKLVRVSKTDFIAAKSAIGICTPFLKRRNDASFLMLVFYCVNSAHLSFIRSNYGGLDEGASARRFLLSGSANLVQLAAKRDLHLLGGDRNHQKEITMSSASVFNFDSHEVRIIPSEKPLFVASDVAISLGYKNPRLAIKQFCKGGVKHSPLKTNGGIQQVRVIHEPDVYRLIFGSKLKSAQRFQNWVFEEVLPTIRKTGAYIPNRSIETITPEQYQSLRYIVWGIGNRFQKSNAAEFAAWRALRQYAGVNRVQLIPNDKLNDCIAFLHRLQASLEPFKEAVSKAETRLFQRNFVLSDQDIRRIEQEANNGE